MSFKSWLESHPVRAARLLFVSAMTLLTLALLGACTVTSSSGGTLTVTWTVASTTDAAQCATYGAETISIQMTDASGNQSVTSAPCADFNTSISGLSSGTYSVQAQMVDASGASVSTIDGPLSVLINDGETTTQAFDFPVDSFGATSTGDGLLTVTWTIADSGTPADCTGAGAASIELQLYDATNAPIGAPTDVGCSEFTATISGIPTGEALLTAKLVDASGADVTTTISVGVNVSTAGTLQALNFPDDSILSSASGTGSIAVTWEIASDTTVASCDEHSAASIELQVYDADGVTAIGDPILAPCVAFMTTISNLPPGDYTISAQMVNDVSPVSTVIPPQPVTVTANVSTPQDFDFPTNSFTQ
jgi:hypothetical protein